MNGRNGHLMVSKRSRVRTWEPVSNPLPLFVERINCRHRTCVWDLSQIPQNYSKCVERARKRGSPCWLGASAFPWPCVHAWKRYKGIRATTRYSNGFRDFQSKSEWLLASRILVFERDRIRNYSFESGNNEDEHDGFCIIIECLWGNTKFSLRIKNYPRGQVQKNCLPSRVDIIIQHSLMARRCLETILIEKIFVDDAVITIKADFQSPSLSLSRFSLNYYRILKSFPLWKDFGKLGVFPRRAIILLSPRAK